MVIGDMFMMKNFFSNRLKSKKGTSRIVVLFALIALVLVGVVAYLIITEKTEKSMQDLDYEIVQFVEKQATTEFQNHYKPFTAVYDSENKRFVDEKEARDTVTPYGSSTETQGKYILVTVDDEGNITTEWISPY